MSDNKFGTYEMEIPSHLLLSDKAAEEYINNLTDDLRKKLLAEIQKRNDHALYRTIIKYQSDQKEELQLKLHNRDVALSAIGALIDSSAGVYVQDTGTHVRWKRLLSGTAVTELPNISVAVGPIKDVQENGISKLPDRPLQSPPDRDHLGNSTKEEKEETVQWNSDTFNLDWAGARITLEEPPGSPIEFDSWHAHFKSTDMPPWLCAYQAVTIRKVGSPHSATVLAKDVDWREPLYFKVAHVKTTAFGRVPYTKSIYSRSDARFIATDENGVVHKFNGVPLYSREKGEWLAIGPVYKHQILRSHKLPTVAAKDSIMAVVE